MNDMIKMGSLARQAGTEADAQADLSAFWMPFTANRQYKAQPRLLARAEGMHYYTPEGRPVLDATRPALEADAVLVVHEHVDDRGMEVAPDAAATTAGRA